MQPFPMTFWGGAESVPNTGLIDSYTTSLWGTYGLVRMRSAYNGNCLKVRRSSDNTELDIGFVANVIDTASMLTFVGAGNGFVSKWYDQSGAGNDIAQSTTALQPMIVDTGVYTGELLGDGVDDYLISAATIGTGVSGLTMHVGGRHRLFDTAANRTMVYAAGAGFYQGRNTAAVGDYTSDQTNSSTGVQAWLPALAYPNSVITGRVDRAGASVADEVLIYSGGIAATASGAGSGSAVTGNFTAGQVVLGSDTANPTKWAAKNFSIYEVAQSAGTILSYATAATPSWNVNALDSYTTNLWALCHVTKKITAYAGSCLRVRRASDNAEQDIGFTAGGLIDSAAILSFGSGTTCFVVTFYDQSGNGNNFTQATTANQPQISVGATYYGYLSFDGTNDCFASVNNSGTPSAFTAFIHGKLSSATVKVVLEQTVGTYINTGAGWYINDARANATEISTTQTSSANMSLSNFDSMITGGVGAARWDRSQVTGAAQSTFFSGGTKLTRAANSDAGTLPTGTFNADKWYFMARSGTSLPTPGQIFGLAIYETAISDANVERISRGME